MTSPQPLSNVLSRAPAETKLPPLMSLSAVQWRLDVDEDDALVLIENGALLWAFNLARRGATRRTIRVLTESVEDLAQHRKRTCADAETEWRRVLGQILPASPVIITCALSRALSLSRMFLMNLVQDREFRLLPGTRPRRGPWGTARFDTASIAAWLRKRRIPKCS